MSVNSVPRSHFTSSCASLKQIRAPRVALLGWFEVLSIELHQEDASVLVVRLSLTALTQVALAAPRDVSIDRVGLLPVPFGTKA